MYKDSRIFIAGHSGLLGNALERRLVDAGYSSLITRPHEELDLTISSDVLDFFSDQKPEYVFLTAGKVGGIKSNSMYGADYFHQNIAMIDNVFYAGQKFGVKNVVFYGSSCMYPKFSEVPIKESQLMTGAVESTSEAYAIAKTAGIVACRAYNKQYDTNRFIALVPCSIYGPGDNFDLEQSHVLSALIRRFDEAKVNGIDSVTLWGTGGPLREFIFSDDLADASLFAIENANRLDNTHYNVGTGVECSIKKLAELIAGIVGYQGGIVWDTDKPDGTARKLLDGSRFNDLGWQPTVEIKDGIKATYEWYKQQSC